MANRSERIGGLSVRGWRYAAAILATVVAAIHLLHPRLGAPRLLLHLQMGTLFDPRPLAFTVSAFLIVFGMVLVYYGIFVRYVYLGGIGLMFAFLAGYAAWHTVLDHGGFWPHLHGYGHDDLGVVETVWIHLVDDTIAMMSKLHEAALLVVLTVLYRFDGGGPA